MVESTERGARVPNEPVPELAADNTAPESEPQAQPQQQAQPQPTALEQAEAKARRLAEIPRGTQFDGKRGDIIVNFRQDRLEQMEADKEEAEELRRMQLQGLPPEMQPEPELEPQQEPEPQPEPKVEAQPEPAPMPKKFKVKVRGQEKEVTEEELLAAAQRGMAGDDYFDETKEELKKVQALRRDLEGQRVAPAAPVHPGAPQPGPQPAGLEPQQPQDLQQQEDPYEKLVHTIQFGEPGEAAKAFREYEQATTQRATQAVRDAVIAQDEQKELQKSQRVLEKFRADNTDIASDDAAEAVIERKVFTHYLQDLRNAGFDESTIPPNLNAIAGLHLKLRATGANVRPIDEIFKAAKEDYLAWKGGTAQPVPVPEPKPEPPKPAGTRTGEPRVEVSVNRDQRRAAIPTQATRTVAPKPDTSAAQQQAPKGNTEEGRSLVVQRMAEQRRAPKQPPVFRGQQAAR